MEDQRIGNYKVLRKIGAGGTAQVYLAVHKDVPNLKVILKILADARLQERFRHEADKLALLDGNANICQIKHFFSHKDDTVIAMEFIDGVSLEEKIETEGHLDTREALRISIELLKTLDFAHGKRVSHRDIKPSNVMIDKRGQVKVIDFGIAKGESDPNLTAVGTACGTPAYMAPEQFNPNADTNYILVDVYAAGSTLYAMLTGKVPFSGSNPFAIRDAKLTADPPPPSKYNTAITAELEKAILKSIARDPAERYQSAAQMIAALQEVAGEVATQDQARQPSMADATIDMATGAPTPPPPTPKKRPVWLIPSAIGAIAVIAIGAWVGLSGGPDGSDTADADTSVSQGPEVPPAPEFGDIEVTIDPNGDVYIDDSLYASGTGGATFNLDTTAHVLRIVNDGSNEKAIVDTVTPAGGFTLRRTYQFTMPAPPPRPREQVQPTYGKVRPGPRNATVYIDGERQEQVGGYTFTIRTGSHEIRVEMEIDGVLRSADTTINVMKDSLHILPFKLSN